MDKKKVYTSKEFSELSQLSPSTLRYYEKHHLFPNVKRDNKGYRLYTQENLQWIVFIQKLKNVNMPLKTIREYAQLVEQGVQTRDRRVALLQEHRNKLRLEQNAIEEALESIDEKLLRYKNNEIV